MIRPVVGGRRVDRFKVKRPAVDLFPGALNRCTGCTGLSWRRLHLLETTIAYGFDREIPKGPGFFPRSWITSNTHAIIEPSLRPVQQPPVLFILSILSISFSMLPKYSQRSRPPDTLHLTIAGISVAAQFPCVLQPRTGPRERGRWSLFATGPARFRCLHPRMIRTEDLCGRDARAPGGASSHDIVTPTGQNCRSIWFCG